MTLVMRLGSLRSAGLVFLATSLWLYWTRSHNFVMSNDEGIFLDGSRRILAGQVPYRDFFILMGPGSFWLQASALKVFGMTLAASRVVTMLDLAVLAGCVYWLVAQESSRALAAFVSASFIILNTADPVVALPNHRWDSAALATLAVTIAASRKSGLALALSGVCAASAAWVTPTVGLAALAIGGCLLWKDRGLFWPFAAGGAVVTIAAAGMLTMQGAFGPMLDQMLWTGTNYSQANRMPYGSRFGGYFQLFSDVHGMEWVTRSLIVLGLTLPAILPPIALVLAWMRRKSTELIILAAGAVALLASEYPRFDVPHLTYAAPLFYALLAPGIASTPRLRTPVFLLASLLAAMFGLYSAMHRVSETEVATPVGIVRASGEDLSFLQHLNRDIPRGSNLFVFPYLPVVYFLTLSHNPIRYSYLQAGMMSDADESIALSQLQAAPPERVLYYDLPEAQVLRIWPGSDPSRLRMRRIEAYLAEHYQPMRKIPYQTGGFRLLGRVPDTAASR